MLASKTPSGRCLTLPTSDTVTPSARMPKQKWLFPHECRPLPPGHRLSFRRPLVLRSPLVLRRPLGPRAFLVPSGLLVLRRLLAPHRLIAPRDLLASTTRRQPHSHQNLRALVQGDHQKPSCRRADIAVRRYTSTDNDQKRSPRSQRKSFASVRRHL